MKRKIIIDCDPGHDDVMAIFSAMAHPESLEIVGYTTVCGNQLVHKVTRNLCQIMTVLKETPMIAQGYDQPLIFKPEPQPLAHGDTGLDGPILPEPTVAVDSRHALEFLRDCLMESDEKITIVALAPLTNVAMLLKTYPFLKDKIEAIAMMGGSIHRGNILKRSEFNIYEDSHAAKIVFESGVPLILAPLEVCDDCSLPHEIIDGLKGKGPVSSLAHDILQFFSQYSRKRNATQSPIFDLAVIMDLLHPEYFTSQMANVSIEVDGQYTRGMTVIDFDDEKKNTLVLTHCDQQQFIDAFLKDLAVLDQKMLG